MAKNLIIYYSRKGENYVNGSIKKLSKGNTEIVAEFIQKAVGGDLFEVDTVKPYSEDYTACVYDELHSFKSAADHLQHGSRRNGACYSRCLMLYLRNCSGNSGAYFL